MTRTALETAVRAWLVLAGVLGGIPNADRAVIFADEDGTRPAQPYLVVKLTVPSTTVGDDESWADAAATPQHHVRGNRFATVSVHAYGATAYDWLDRAGLRLRAPTVKAANTTAGIAVQAIGGIRDLSALRDQATERRWHQDFRVDYVRQTGVSETEGLVELGVVEVEEHWDGSPSERVVTQTIEVS